MLSLFKRIYRGLFMFSAFKPKTEGEYNNVTLQIENIKENKWFTKANNLLVAPFEQPKISSAYFSRYEWPIERNFMGFIILAQDEKDFKYKQNRIIKGDTKGFYTVEEFTNKFGALNYEEEVNVFHDDVSLIKGKGVIKPPIYNAGKTYTIGYDPYRK